MNFPFCNLFLAHILSLQADSELSTIAEETVATTTPQDLHGGLGTLQSGEAQGRANEPAEPPAATTSESTQIAAPLTRPTMIEPAYQAAASSTRVNRAATMRRKPTRDISSGSLGSKPASTAVGIPPQAVVQLLTVYQSSDQPLAFNFFNPATDIQRGGSLASHPTNLGVSAEQRSTNLVQTAQPLRRSDSLSRRGSFLSLPAANQPPSPSHFRTHFGATTVRELSPFTRAVGGHGRPLGVYADKG